MQEDHTRKSLAAKASCSRLMPHACCCYSHNGCYCYVAVSYIFTAFCHGIIVERRLLSCYEAPSSTTSQAGSLVTLALISSSAGGQDCLGGVLLWLLTQRLHLQRLAAAVDFTPAQRSNVYSSVTGSRRGMRNPMRIEAECIARMRTIAKRCSSFRCR